MVSLTNTYHFFGGFEKEKVLKFVGKILKCLFTKTIWGEEKSIRKSVGDKNKSLRGENWLKRYENREENREDDKSGIKGGDVG